MTHRRGVRAGNDRTAHVTFAFNRQKGPDMAEHRYEATALKAGIGKPYLDQRDCKSWRGAVLAGAAMRKRHPDADVVVAHEWTREPHRLGFEATRSKRF